MCSTSDKKLSGLVLFNNDFNFYKVRYGDWTIYSCYHSAIDRVNSSNENSD